MSAYVAIPKTEMIERSLQCFVLGLFGLLPVIGIPMALVAIWDYHRAKRIQAATWNPAQQYLFWGGLCARMGLIIPLLLLLAITAAVLN